MPNLKQHTDPSGTFGTLGLGTVEAIRIKDTGEVEIPNLNNPTLAGKLDTANAFGVGQTWVNVTASRASGVTYTNSTDKTIIVSANSAGSTGIQIDGYVGGALIRSEAYNGSSGIVGMYLHVPAGATYSLVFTGPGGIARWSEFR